MRRRLRILVLPAVLLALVACGGGREDPKAFRERADLASCGSIGAHRPGDPFTPAEHAKVACLTGAHETGTGAELRLTLLDTEGGRSYLWVRALVGGSAEEYLHVLESEYSDEVWQLTICTGFGVDDSGMPHGTDCAASTTL